MTATDVPVRAKKNETTIRKGLDSFGQAGLAKELEVDESWVSRWKDREVERIGKALALLGLKVVPVDMKCFPQDQIEAIFALAKARMQEMDSAEKLQFDD